MTGQQIPQRLDPFKQIGSALKYDGKVALNRLNRLDDLLAEKDGEVLVSLRFFRDEQQTAVVAGSVTADLSLICQRCNKADVYHAFSEFEFALIRKEDEADLLPESYEPMMLDTPELDVFEIIEEELILSLPLVHYHSDDHESRCAEVNKDNTFGAIAEPEENPNPFAVLGKLKS